MLLLLLLLPTRAAAAAKFHLPCGLLYPLAYLGAAFTALTGRFVKLTPFTIRMLTIHRYFDIAKVTRAETRTNKKHMSLSALTSRDFDIATVACPPAKKQHQYILLSVLTIMAPGADRPPPPSETPPRPGRSSATSRSSRSTSAGRRPSPRSSPGCSRAAAARNPSYPDEQLPWRAARACSGRIVARASA